MRYGLRCVLTVTLFLSLLATVSAQDQPQAGDAKEGPRATAEQFPELLAAWDKITGELEAMKAQYQAAPASERAAIRQKYVTLGKEAEKQLVPLGQAARAVYEAKPNENKQAIRILVGLVADDLQRDEIDRAVELAQLLLKHDCPEKALLGLAGQAAYCQDDFEKAADWMKQADTARLLDFNGKEYLRDATGAVKKWQSELDIRQKEAAADDLPRVKLETTKGAIVIELFENEAPNTVANFISLVEDKFYDGLTFHRVLGSFMAQGGCPKGDGGGGPGYKIACECYRDDHREHFRGTLSMAHAGKDTGGSQFFITFRRTAHLDGRHTAFGRVIEGLDVLPKLERRNPEQAGKLPTPDKIVKATVVRKRDHAYEPKKK